MGANTTMESQKEQSLSIVQNNTSLISMIPSPRIRVHDGNTVSTISNTVTLCSIKNNIDMSLNKEFHFREVVAWIMSKMNLEFDKKYKLREIINNILETGNQVESVKGKYFDSDLYLGIKDQITTDFRKHVLLNILVEEESKREALDYILDHINDEVTINEASLTSHISISETEYHLKLYSLSGLGIDVPVVAIRIPY